MATVSTVVRYAKKALGMLNEQSLTDRVEWAYRVCTPKRSMKYDGTDGKGRPVWVDMGEYGSGANESMVEFKKLCAEGIFGPMVHAWPADDVPGEVRVEMARLKCMAHQIPAMKGIVALGCHRKFLDVVTSRGAGSPYRFENPELYRDIVLEFGTSWESKSAAAYDAIAVVRRRLLDLTGETYKLRVVRSILHAAEGNSGVAERIAMFYAAGYKSATTIVEALATINPDRAVEFVGRFKAETLLWSVPTSKAVATIRQIAQAYHNWLRQDYGLLPVVESIRIMAGEDPTVVMPAAGSRKEAMKVLRGDTPELVTEIRSLSASLLLSKLDVESAQHRNTISRLDRKSPMVVQWVIRKWKESDALYRERTMYVHGTARTYTYVTRLDEITDDDLVNGLKTSPKIAFARATTRIELAALHEYGEDVELPKSPMSEIEGVRQISTSKDLIAEGKDMGHCVAGYVLPCINEVSYIFAVGFEDECASTLEMNRSGEIAQHLGPGNSIPPRECQELVTKFLRHNKNKIA